MEVEDYVKNALWRARQDINKALKELLEDIDSQRESTRYYNSQYHRYRKTLRFLNNKKRRLQRQLLKVDQTEAALSKAPTNLNNNDKDLK